MSGRLDGRVAIVTGASGGLGEAYARALAGAGAAVVLGARRADRLDRLAAELPKARVVAGSTADPTIATSLVDEACSRFGRVDVVVNNAGALHDRTLLKMSVEEFDDVLDSHVRSAFLVTQCAASAMRSQGSGAIINVGSDSGLRGAFGQTNYAAAKGALAAMTLTWAKELARYEIGCNCILPNAKTAMTGGLDELLASYRYAPDSAGFPRAMGEPRDAAPLVVHLAAAGPEVTGLIVGIGGDKLSIWEPAREVAWAYRQGGWSAEAVEAELELVLRGDPNGGGYSPDYRAAINQPAMEGKKA